MRESPFLEFFPYKPTNQPEYRRKAISLDLHGRTLGHRVKQPDCVPIRQPDTAVASRAANRAWIVRSVNPNTFFVEADPDESHLVSRSRRDVIKVATSSTVQ